MRAPIKNVILPVALLATSGALLFDRVSPQVVASPEPAAVDGVALGRAYSPVLVAGYADAWVAAARALDEGKPVSEAQKVLQDAWKDARIKAFRRHVQPGFSVILPEGTEPTEDAKRSEVSALWRSFAKGLREGR